MESRLQRGLFWRVYSTLLASLVAAALLGATAWRLATGRHALRLLRMRAGPMMGEHLLLMLLTAAALTALGAYPVVSRITRRLERLRSSLDAWGQGGLARRAEVEGDDEIAAVAMSFNAAADRVEGLLAAHKTLLAHASHELRSPLARLRIGVEMMASKPDPALLPGLVRDMAELDALVEEILLASRLDQGSAPFEPEPIDLLALAAEEAARGRAALAPPGEGAFEVEGSPRLLRRAIRNLVENAARHGAPPIEVELTRRLSGGCEVVAVRVGDRGPGVAEAERERVFQPFHRPQGWAEAAGGWGLGLSIVRQIAEAHGGFAACEPRPGGGARFVLALPAAPPAAAATPQGAGTARSGLRTRLFSIRSSESKS